MLDVDLTFSRPGFSLSANFTLRSGGITVLAATPARERRRLQTCFQEPSRRKKAASSRTTTFGLIRTRASMCPHNHAASVLSFKPTDFSRISPLKKPSVFRFCSASESRFLPSTSSSSCSALKSCWNAAPNPFRTLVGRFARKRRSRHHHDGGREPFGQNEHAVLGDLQRGLARRLRCRRSSLPGALDLHDSDLRGFGRPSPTDALRVAVNAPLPSCRPRPLLQAAARKAKRPTA